jgi:Flp pilus assembly pilin Flp
MTSHLVQLWSNDDGQDIAEYAVMLAVILVIVVGTIRLIGSNANTVFSQVASSVQQRQPRRMKQRLHREPFSARARAFSL